MAKNVVFSVVFPSVVSYLPDYFNSINEQSLQADKIILLNDGIENLSECIDEFASQLNIDVHNYSNSPIKNREKGLSILQKEDADHIIFQDADDWMSSNRILDASEKLKLHPLVFHDLSLVSKKGKRIASNIWKDRFLDQSVIDIDFIEDKNVLGFGNTSIRKSLIESVEIPANIIAADWFVFSRLIKDHQAKFSSDSCIYYRQYEDNIAGIKKPSKAGLEHCYKVVYNHYSAMQWYDIRYLAKLNHLIEIHDRLRHLTDQEILESKIITFGGK